MTQHYTKLTVEASHWCGKCAKNTIHRVDQGRIGPCLPCMAKFDREKALRPAKVEVTNLQARLFGEAT